MDEIDEATRRWFLTPAERGNPSTDIDRIPRDDGRGWVAGNRVRPLIHGAAYFARLYDELCDLDADDRVYFTDWCGDADQKLLPGGATVGETLCDLARNGIEVRGLVWRSHSRKFAYNAQDNERLGTQVNKAGGEILLDQRIRRFGSHHQKMFVIQHGEDSSRDVAFVGGIDLRHGRRDDAVHHGDPQQMPMDPRYRGRAPWHDAALELRGPVVGDLLRTFVERWDDPTPLDRRTPYRMLMQRRAHMPRHPKKLPESFPDPEPSGPVAVQVLRTYGRKRPHYPFARHGERSIARAYEKAFARAQSLIYVEDQYLWSHTVARGIADALRRSPRLQVIAVVPRYPDADDALNGPPNRLGQLRAMDMLRCAAPDRVADGDGARALARNLRLELWSEHLGRPADDPALLDPFSAVGLWQRTAAALDAWNDQGRRGPRPPGQVRRHDPAGVGRLTRFWADPFHRIFFDPDDRPRDARRGNRF